MKIKCYTLLLLICGLGLSILGSCKPSGRAVHLEQGHSTPTPPIHIDNPREGLSYMINHYWDGINLSDTTFLGNASMLEGVVADYLGLLVSADAPESLRLRILYPLETVPIEYVPKVLNIYRQYLYDPGAPLEDEEVFKIVLAWAETSPKVPEGYQVTSREILRLLRLNEIGSQATEIVYTSPEGSKRRLSRILEPYTLLFFGTYGCEVCAAAYDYLTGHPVVRQLADKKKLRLLYIYVQDDPERTLEALSPELGWVETGRDTDGQITGTPLYDLKSSPTIYLLDKQKTVLLKNASLPQLINHLEQVHQH